MTYTNNDIRIIRTGGGRIWYANVNCQKCNDSGQRGIEDCECVKFMDVRANDD